MFDWHFNNNLGAKLILTLLAFLSSFSVLSSIALAAGESSGSASHSSVFYKYENYDKAKTHVIYGNGYGKNIGWGFSLSQTRVKFDQNLSTGGVNSLTDTQNMMSGGMSYQFPDTSWSVGLNYSLGRSPEENLTLHGPTASLGYNKGEWTFDASLSSVEYSQSLTTADRTSKVVTPTTGTNSIRQNSLRLGMNWVVDESIDIYLSFTKYRYSKNLDDFIHYLDIYDGNTNLLAGLQNQFSAFNDNVVNLKTKLEIEEWDITYSLLRAVSATNDKVTLFHTIEFSHDFADQWVAYGGAGLANTEAQAAVKSKSVNYFFAGVGKGF